MVGLRPRNRADLFESFDSLTGAVHTQAGNFDFQICVSTSRQCVKLTGKNALSIPLSLTFKIVSANHRYFQPTQLTLQGIMMMLSVSIPLLMSLHVTSTSKIIRHSLLTISTNSSPDFLIEKLGKGKELGLGEFGNVGPAHFS